MSFSLGLKGEDNVQAEIIRWCRKQERAHPALGSIYHIPNGGARSMAAGMKFKALGVRAGVPDLHLPIPKNGFAGLWLEIKDGDKGRLSDVQELWIAALRNWGHRVEVVRDVATGISILKDYLNIVDVNP